MKFKKIAATFQLSLLLFGFGASAALPLMTSTPVAQAAEKKEAKKESSNSKRKESSAKGNSNSKGNSSSSDSSSSGDSSGSSSSSSSSSGSTADQQEANIKKLPEQMQKIIEQIKTQNNLFNDDFPSAAQSAALSGPLKYTNKAQLLTTFAYLSEQYGSGARYSTLYSQADQLINTFNTAAPGITFPKMGNKNVVQDLTNSTTKQNQAPSTKAEKIATSTYATDMTTEQKQDWMKKNTLGQMAMKFAGSLADNAVKAISVSDNRDPYTEQYADGGKDDGTVGHDISNALGGVVTDVAQAGNIIRGKGNATSKYNGNWQGSYFVNATKDTNTRFRMDNSRAKGMNADVHSDFSKYANIGNLIGTSNYAKSKQSDLQGLIAIRIMDSLANQNTNIDSKSELERYLSDMTAQKYGDTEASGNGAADWKTILKEINNSMSPVNDPKSISYNIYDSAKYTSANDAKKDLIDETGAILPSQASAAGASHLGEWYQNYIKYMKTKAGGSVSDDDWKTFQDFAKSEAALTKQAKASVSGDGLIGWSPTYPYSSDWSKDNQGTQDKLSQGTTHADGFLTNGGSWVVMRNEYFFDTKEKNLLYDASNKSPISLAFGANKSDIITDNQSAYNYTNASIKDPQTDQEEISKAYASAFKGSSVGGFQSNTDLVGFDSYGNIIDGKNFKVIVPYWNNTLVKSLMNNPVIKTNSHDFGIKGSGVSGEASASDSDIASVAGQDTQAYKLAEKAKTALNSAGASASMSQEIAAVNKAVGQNSGSSISNKAAAALAILITAKTQKGVEAYNQSFITKASDAKQLYLGQVIQAKADDSKSQSVSTALYTASDIIQRIGLQTDYGSFDQLRKTMVTMIASTYDSEFLRGQTQNIFATDTFGNNGEFTRYGMAPYFAAMIILEVVIGIVTIWQYTRGEVKASAFFTRTLKFIAGVLIIICIHPVENYLLNTPGNWAIQDPLKQQSVVDQWSKLKQEQTLNNVFYSSLFQDKSNQVNNSADYMIPFYTSTLNNGQVDTAVSDPMQTKSDDDKGNVSVSTASVANSAAYKYGNGKVPWFTNTKYKTVNVTLADLTNWASHMARQIYTAQGKDGFKKGESGYEAPSGGYDAGKEPLFAWLANDYQPISSPGQENSGQEIQQDSSSSDSSSNSTGGGTGTGTGTGTTSGSNVTAPKSDAGADSSSKKVTMTAKVWKPTAQEKAQVKAAAKKQSFTFNGGDGDQQITTQDLTYNPNDQGVHIDYLADKKSSGIKAPTKEEQKDIKKNTATFNIPSDKKDSSSSSSSGADSGLTGGVGGGTGAGTGTGTGGGGGGTAADTSSADASDYGKKRNPADTSLKSAYDDNLTGNQINNSALYKNFGNYAEFAVNTKHNASKSDIAYGVDMDSKGGKLTASQAFLKIWMQIFANSGDGGNPGDANSLTSLMNFAQAMNGNMGGQTTSGNVGQDNDGSGTTLQNVGQTGRNDLINELSMTKSQRKLLNGDQNFSTAAQEMINTFQIPAGSSDYFNFDQKNSIIDAMQPYLYKSQTSRDGLIFKLNKAMLNDYVSDYSVVRAEIDPSGANSSDDPGSNDSNSTSTSTDQNNTSDPSTDGNNQADPNDVDPYTMAEDQIMAVDAFFRINQIMGYSMFPKGYEANSISLDSWDRILFIPVGVMNTLSSNNQYNQDDTTNASPVTARDNIIEYLSLNTSLFSLLGFIIMNYMLIAFGILMTIVFKYVFPVIIIIVLFRNFISTKHKTSMRGLFQGTLGLFAVFGIMKFGLIYLISFLSKTMNNDYMEAGGYTSMPVGSHSLAVIFYLGLAFAFLIKIYAPFVAKDVSTFGARDGFIGRDLARGARGRFGNPMGNRRRQGIINGWIHRRQEREKNQESDIKKRVGRGTVGIKRILNGAAHPVNTITQSIEDKRSMAELSEDQPYYKRGTDDLKGRVADLKNAKYGGVKQTSSNGLDLSQLNVENVRNGDKIDSIEKGSAAFNIGSKSTAEAVKKILHDDHISNAHVDGNNLVIDNTNSSMLNTAGGRKEVFDKIIRSTAKRLDQVSKLGNGNITETPKNFVGLHQDPTDDKYTINVDSKNGIDPDKVGELMRDPVVASKFEVIDSPVEHDGHFSSGKLVLKARDGFASAKTTNELQSRLHRYIDRKNFEKKYTDMVNVGHLKPKEIIKMQNDGDILPGMEYSEGRVFFNRFNKAQNEAAQDLSKKFKTTFNNSNQGLSQFVDAGQNYVVDGAGHGFETPQFTSTQAPNMVTQRFKTNNREALMDGLQGLSNIAHNPGITGEAINAQREFNQALLQHYASPMNLLDAYNDYAHRNHMKYSQDTNNLVRKITNTVNNYGPADFKDLEKSQQENIEHLIDKLNTSLEKDNQLNTIQNGVSTGLNIPESKRLSEIRQKIIHLSGAHDPSIFNKMTVGQIGSNAAQATSMKNMTVDENGVLTGDIPLDLASGIGQQRVSSLIRGLTE